MGIRGMGIRYGKMIAKINEVPHEYNNIVILYNVSCDRIDKCSVRDDTS